jgi:hypothetical protein
MNDLRELDRELAQIPQGSQFDDARSTWYSRTFNNLDWLSFLINEKVVAHYGKILRRHITEKCIGK